MNDKGSINKDFSISESHQCLENSCLTFWFKPGKLQVHSAFLLHSSSPVRLREAAHPGRWVILRQCYLHVTNWLFPHEYRGRVCVSVCSCVFGCRVSSHANSGEILSGRPIVIIRTES